MVSIIVPVYNRVGLISETLDSIRNQTYANWECIIVDDWSTDDTFEIVKKYCTDDVRFKIHKRPLSSTKGPSTCRNYGFQLALGEFVQFFDSDDIMHPDHLQEKTASICEHDFVVCKIQDFSGDFSKEGSLRDKYPDIVKVDSIFESFATGEFYMLMMFAPLWKKEAIAPFMPMREDMHILEDHELYARILFHKNNYAVINKELIYYRVGLSSLLNSFYKDVSYGLDSYFEAKKTVLNLSNSPKIKFSILKMTLSLFRMALAQKQFDAAKKCLQFCRQQKLFYSFTLKYKMLRIYAFFLFVLLTKRGDTYLKSNFKV